MSETKSEHEERLKRLQEVLGECGIYSFVAGRILERFSAVEANAANGFPPPRYCPPVDGNDPNYTATGRSRQKLTSGQIQEIVIEVRKALQTYPSIDFKTRDAVIEGLHRKLSRELLGVVSGELGGKAVSVEEEEIPLKVIRRTVTTDGEAEVEVKVRRTREWTPLQADRRGDPTFLCEREIGDLELDQILNREPQADDPSSAEWLQRIIQALYAESARLEEVAVGAESRVDERICIARAARLANAAQDLANVRKSLAQSAAQEASDQPAEAVRAVTREQGLNTDGEPEGPVLERG